MGNFIGCKAHLKTTAIVNSSLKPDRLVPGSIGKREVPARIQLPGAN